MHQQESKSNAPPPDSDATLDLAEVLARHRQILDSAVETAIISTDLEGRVRTWSAGAEHILGWSESEMQGQSLERIFTAEDLATGRLQAEISDALARGHGRHEGWRVRRDDIKIWAVGEMTPLLNGAGEAIGLVKVIRDQTAQRTAERAIRESEEYLRQITEALPGFTWTANRDGAVEYMGSRWEHYTGTSAADALGHGWMALLHPEDRGRVPGEWQAAIEAGKPYDAEMRYLRSDGQFRWFLSRATPLNSPTGDILRWIGVSVDIHAQKIEQAQSAEEARILEILNKAGSALATETNVEVLVQAVTDAGVQLSGAQFGAFFYNVENEKGESYMLYSLSGVDREAFAKFPMPRNTAIFAPTFSGNAVVRSDDITQDPKFGHSAPHYGMPKGHLPVRSYLALPVVSRSGGVIGGLFFGHSERGRFDKRSESLIGSLAAEAAVAIDNARLLQAMEREVEERARAEQKLQLFNSTLEQQIQQRTEQLRENEEALRQSQKMEAVGQLTGGIAHDFNNLLQIITGNLEVIQRKLPPESDRLIRAAGQAMSGAKRAAALTQHLLAFSRRQALNPKPLDTKRLIARTIKLLARTLGEQIEIKADLPGDLWNIEVDENELESALLNLGVNARDAMPSGGVLIVRARNLTIDNAAALGSAVSAGAYVELKVIDAGLGMDADTVGRVFEPFFTTKPIGKGTGLGLSQVYGFVKQSGGHIEVQSSLGKGTTIEILLPRFDGPVEGVKNEEVSRLPTGTNRETILVVEDDDDVRAFSVESLRELGYHVIEAHDASSALHLLKRDQVVDLIFSDVILPGSMTGADIVRDARRSHPHIKVLFTSGYAKDAIVHNGRLDRGVQLLPKPFSSADLAHKIRSLLDGPAALDSSLL